MRALKAVHLAFPLSHFIISLMFVAAAVALIVFAALELWEGVRPGAGAPIWNRVNAVLESVDRLVSERRIAPLSPAQRTKAAETLLAVRDKAPAIFRKFWTDPGFRDLPEEQRRASVRAEVETLRTEAQKSLEDFLPAQDAKVLIEETSRGFDGPRAVPFVPRERPQ